MMKLCTEFEGVIGPPGFDDCQAVCHGGDVDLRIIGVTVDVESTLVNDLGSHVNNVGERAEHRALRNTVEDLQWFAGT